jgi:hypothetical protein
MENVGVRGIARMEGGSGGVSKEWRGGGRSRWSRWSRWSTVGRPVTEGQEEEEEESLPLCACESECESERERERESECV